MDCVASQCPLLGKSDDRQRLAVAGQRTTAQGVYYLLSGTMNLAGELR